MAFLENERYGGLFGENSRDRRDTGQDPHGSRLAESVFFLLIEASFVVTVAAWFLWHMGPFAG